MLSKQEKNSRRTKKAGETRKKNREAKINSTYLSREWLFSRYCIDRMSLDEIGNLCRVEYDIIWGSLLECKIPILLLAGEDFWWDWVEKNKSKIPYKGVK